jgi:hypothetical protein
MRVFMAHPQLVLLAALSCTVVFAAQAPSVPLQPTPARHAHLNAVSSTAPAEPAAPPPPPNWPINDTPTPASVRLDTTGLRIDATNSSLKQILDDIASATGTRVEGFNQDQRVFGSFGPGRPRDVLAQLLQGSGYNIVMIGDQGTGAPRELVLSGRKTGSGAPQPNARPAQDDNDDDAYDNQIDTQPPPPPQVDPPARFPPEGARTPQQIQQELQQRQQQLLMQQQQMQPIQTQQIQPQQLQQTTTPPPN